MTARTPDDARQTAEEIVEDLLEEIVAAAASLGLDAELRDGTVGLDGARFRPRIEQRAHPTPAELANLVSAGSSRYPAMVIADRISDAGRDALREAGWGWLDRRGHLRVWTTGLRIDSNFTAEFGQPHTSSNLWTAVGREVALAALVDPTQKLTARRVAPVIGRSVAATHEMIARFVAVGLIGARTRLALLPDLFWETAAQWPDDRWLPLPMTLAEVAEALATTELIRVDERAATLAGARIPAAGASPSRCYVSSARLLRKAKALSDAAPESRCWVRESPTNWLPLMDDHPPSATHPWRVAHPIVSALRLARDPARGREIVENWGIVPSAPT